MDLDNSRSQADSRSSNDVMSFPKELVSHHLLKLLLKVLIDMTQKDGVDQNLVALYGRQGLTPQEAYDKTDTLLKARYRQWYLAQADLPQWGEAIDKQVQRYVQGLQDIAKANLHWG